MIFLILFSFIAGVVTILSPCILPILPIVLSGSVGTGKKRPFGIVTGFIISFTFFTLFLSTLVKLTGVSADFLRTFSVIIVLLFGISLLIPRVQLYMEQLFSKLARFTPKTQGDTGFTGGLAIGISLGLVWTPCVGPIIASVITLAASSNINAATFFITLAYSIGTAIPMLAITYGGRTLLQKVPWLLKNTGTIQKLFGVLMILTALAIALNFDRTFQSYILEKFPQYGTGLTKLEENETVSKALKDLRSAPSDTSQTAPELIPGGEWFNSPPLTIASLRGKVVLVDFWTYTCINCVRTLPYIQSWHTKYASKGLVIIGVHTPEFAFEKKASNVRLAIADFKLTYPVMQDNNFDTWNAYSNQYWPAKYLIDKDGRIRYTHFGEGEYDKTEEIIKQLLNETGADVQNIPVSNQSYETYARTPELYLGNSRIQYLSSPENIIVDKKMQFTEPTALPANSFAYTGSWTVGEERAMPHKGAKLTLQFDAKNAYLVMRPLAASPGRIRVLLDGAVVTTANAGVDVKNGVVTIASDRLYTLINLPKAGKHTLILEFLDDNLELYAFTFG
ncbi:MAG: hypothetical protein RI947_734 [Candidatus Parcubacteria bacterium]